MKQEDAQSLAEHSGHMKVFAGVASALKSKHVNKLMPLWQDALSSAETELRELVTGAVINHSSNDGERANRVVNKFRGNCGEIFAEKFFKSGLGSDVCKPESYVPVDPNHEEGIDATAVSCVSNMKIGIQVKNFAKSKVGLETFRTAGDESDKLSHALENVEQFVDFLRCPSQVIFSFTEAEDVIVKDYEKRVRFLGPSYIESKGICGKKGDSCGNWTFFQDIVDEIDCLHV